MFEAGLRARLKNSDAVTAFAPTIDWEVRPQGQPLPALVLLIVSDLRDQHFKGFTLRETRTQIDVMANTADAKVRLRNAVLATVVPAASLGNVTFQRATGVTVRSRSENTDSEGFIHRDVIDLTFWTRETE